MYAIPSDLAIRTSLRVQQILAYETGVADVVDPLGGSYYVEALTDEMEAKIGETIGKIESDGGIVKLIESGSIQRELARQELRAADADQFGGEGPGWGEQVQGEGGGAGPGDLQDGSRDDQPSASAAHGGEGEPGQG